MSYLIPGLSIFFLIHMIPSMPGTKTAIVGRVGTAGYRGLFSLLAFTSVVLIVMGLRSADFVALYQPPVWGRTATFVLSFIAIYSLLSGPFSPSFSSLKTITPSPLSWGVTCWSAGHLLSNGDVAHVMLFSMFLLFGVINILSTRIRGDKPVLAQRPPVMKELVFVVIIAAIYVALVHGHRYFTGMPLV